MVDIVDFVFVILENESWLEEKSLYEQNIYLSIWIKITVKND